MLKEIAISVQSFETLIRNSFFYVDKTLFIKDWYRSGDSVTLITRPRRFGKTLTMSMMNCFFSVRNAGKSGLFTDLEISKYAEFMEMQGTFPVISFSLANIKPQTFDSFLAGMSAEIRNIYRSFKIEGIFNNILDEDRKYIDQIILDEQRGPQGEIRPLSADTMIFSMNRLCGILHQVYGRKAMIFLDEYDTPLLEAWLNGYWEQASGFIRSFFNSTFKTNEYLDRALLTGITRIAKESIFSDLNNLAVYSVSSDRYSDVFGFTEEEVFAALDEYELSSEKDNVRKWYDGFTFGSRKDIYNPWSIINYLKDRSLETYWANTSSGSLIDSLIRNGDEALKTEFEELLKGNTVDADLNEGLIFQDLTEDSQAVWSLMLAAGYIKAVSRINQSYTLKITNHEIQIALESMVRRWFSKAKFQYSGFIRSLTDGDTEAMNQYMNGIAREVFSSFDSGRNPENFYHGFVLGLVVALQGRYFIQSNKESGYGRYDILMEPLHDCDPAIIIEFKVYDAAHEQTLEQTAERALKQIEARHYDAILTGKNISASRIVKYGFAFRGKEILIASR